MQSKIFFSIRVEAAGAAAGPVPGVSDTLITEAATSGRCDVWSSVHPPLELSDVTAAVRFCNADGSVSSAATGFLVFDGEVRSQYDVSESIRQRVVAHLRSVDALKSAIGLLNRSTQAAGVVWRPVIGSEATRTEGAQAVRAPDSSTSATDSTRIPAPHYSVVFDSTPAYMRNYDSTYFYQNQSRPRPESGYRLQDLIIARMPDTHRREEHDRELLEKYPDYVRMMRPGGHNHFEQGPYGNATGRGARERAEYPYDDDDGAYQPRATDRSRGRPVGPHYEREYESTHQGSVRTRSVTQSRRLSMSPSQRQRDFGHLQRRVAPLDDGVRYSDDGELLPQQQRNASRRVKYAPSPTRRDLSPRLNPNARRRVEQW